MKVKKSQNIHYIKKVGEKVLCSVWNFVFTYARLIKLLKSFCILVVFFSESLDNHVISISKKILNYI